MTPSVAEVYRSLAMGSHDRHGRGWPEGMRAIAREGGLTVGQDEASCSVYGITRSLRRAGPAAKSGAFTPDSAADSSGDALPASSIDIFSESIFSFLIVIVALQNSPGHRHQRSVENGLCKYNPYCL
jgi:hypothetical protein